MASASLPVNDLIGACKRVDGNDRDKSSAGIEVAVDHSLLRMPKNKKLKSGSKAEQLKEETTSLDPVLDLTAKIIQATHLDGPSVKATKSDGATVNEQQWNIWSVDNFKPPGAAVAKVCIPGSYCATKHGQLFD